MCYELAEMHRAGKRLVGTDGLVNTETVAWIVNRWEPQEAGWLQDAITHKYKMRASHLSPRSDSERLMMSVQNLPIEWKEESCLWAKGQLLDDWATTYWAKWMLGAEKEVVCGRYFEGLQWILDYYTGRPISYSWYYPWNLPPLWGDLAAASVSVSAASVSASVSYRLPPTTPVAQQEQLAMVLPEGSWSLVRDKELRRLPTLAPVFWPRTFGFFSAGRRWMWECEAELPILTAGRLRKLLEH